MKEALSQEQAQRLTLENTLKVSLSVGAFPILCISLSSVFTRLEIITCLASHTEQSKEDDIINARAENARLLQEIQRLTEVQADHVEVCSAPTARSSRTTRARANQRQRDRETR